MPDAERAHPAALARLAAEVAEAAGALLIGMQGRVGGVTSKSSATDPVSDADRGSERLITERLLAARPGDGMLGEEGADRPSRTGLRWVVDPLDGTVNYLYRHPGWAVSVACEQLDGGTWRPLAGAVHDPSRGETFWAARRQGAWLGRRRLAVNDPVPLDRALVATGFAYDPAVRARQAALVGQLLPQVRDIRRVGSAALDLCAVAAGRVDAYYEDSTSRWDWAAGVLIAAEAGAVVRQLPPTGSGFGGVLVAGPALTPLLEPLIRPV